MSFITVNSTKTELQLVTRLNSRNSSFELRRNVFFSTTIDRQLCIRALELRAWHGCRTLPRRLQLTARKCHWLKSIVLALPAANCMKTKRDESNVSFLKHVTTSTSKRIEQNKYPDGFTISYATTEKSNYIT